MKKTILFLGLLTLGFSGCVRHKSASNNTYHLPTTQKNPYFKKAMRTIALSTQNNPQYHKLALTTPQKKMWFKIRMYGLWDRQITRKEFIKEGLAMYPNRRYEFNFIANGFQKIS